MKFDRQSCVMQGRTISEDVLGDLREHDVSQLSELDFSREMREHGYLFLRSVISAKHVEQARTEVFARLHEVGEVETPDATGVYTGQSPPRDSWRSWSVLAIGE